MTTQQKALLLEKKFGDLVVRDIAKYTPGPGEILIKVKAAALNPVDWKIQRYGIIAEDFPAVLGTDVAGDVEELGEGVTEFKKGDRVFGQADFVSRNSGYQQYTVALASTIARIPNKISYDDVATLPLTISAAYLGLYNEKPHGAGFIAPTSAAAIGKYTGIPIVILGGSSSVGQFVIQLAKLSGFSPIITTASVKHAAFLATLGATHVLSRTLDLSALSSSVKEITNNKPVSFVYDSISAAETQAIGVGLLAKGGTLVILHAKAVKDEILEKAEVTIIPVIAALGIPWNIALLKNLYHDNLTNWLEEEVIKPNRVEVLPNGLAGVPDGLNRLAAEQVSGVKLVVHPQETV